MTLSRRWRGAAILTLTACSFWSAAVARGAEAANRGAADSKLIRVLRSEAAGQLDQRDEALAAALEESPNHAPTRWQSGYVKWKGQWLKFDEVAVIPEYQAALREYQAVRAKAGKTAAVQLELANWCKAHHLDAQEKLHLSKVIEIDPAHLAARGRLGFVQIGGTWYTRQELADAENQSLEANKSLAKWTPQLKQILAGLAKPSARERTAAEQKLSAIKDPAALPALEAVFIKAPESSALKAVEAIARMKSPEASLSLAKFAVMNPFNEAGLVAAQSLKTRSPDSYIPPLLALLSTPIQSQFEMYLAGNRLVYRQMFFREAEDHRETFGLQHSVEARGDNVPLLNQAIGLQAAGVQAAAADGNARLAARNAEIEKLNKRVSDVLTIATGEKLPPDAQVWWKWWNDRNEVFLPDGKPVQSSYQITSNVVNLPSVTAPPVALSSSGGGSVQQPQTMRCECLVGGTPIWTSAGPVAVEKLQPGDLVLAQNPQSGELCYQPVQMTTTRPAGPVLRLELGTDSIRASGGHPFWVVGQGWVLARHLKAGMRLRDVRGATEIQAVVEEPDAKEVTYNLIVADVHSYFVGKSKVLSHDNTIRRPTSALVPGLLGQ